MTVRNKARTGIWATSVLVKRHLLHNHHVRPIVAELFLTENCNLRCISCACWRRRTEDELTYEEWISIIEQLDQLGFVKMNFTGGEPLLRSDAIDIIRHASSTSRAQLHLNTNALLLELDKIHQLLDAGVRSFNVSIDGATARMHDHIRGREGAFNRSLRNLRELLGLRSQYRLKVRMCATVMKENIAQLADIARLAQHLRVKLFFNVVTDRTFLFRDSAIGPLADLDREALGEALNELLLLKRERSRFLPRYSTICYIASHFENQLQKDLPCAESQLKLMVHSRGQIGGCWAEDPIFSLRARPMADILASTAFKRGQSRLLFKECQGCGSNHSLNMRLEARPLLLDMLWQTGLITKPKTIY